MQDIEEEFRLLQAKLAAIEQKKLALLEAEGEIRTEMQRLENQLHRLRGLGGRDEMDNSSSHGRDVDGMRGA